LCEVLPVTPAKPGQKNGWAEALRAATDAFAASGDAQRGIAAVEAVRARAKPRDAARDAAFDEELAGLRLFAGDEKQAKRYADYIRAGHWTDIPVVGLDRIGWWYYRTGRPQEAVELLSRLVGVTPDSEEVILELAWAQLEAGAPPPATAGFRRSRGQNEWRPRADDPLMGLALAGWLMRQPEEALREFGAASQQRPEWQNAAWVGALYPRNTAGVVEAVKHERERREAAARTLGQSRR
jgi:tetratricopeptide (TPR) repeat protein